MRILIADDDRAARFLLKKIVSSYGEITTASDGGIALDLLEIAKNNFSLFDLVLLDVMMPEIDGFTLLRHIRTADAAENRYTQVILTTAFIDVEYGEMGSARQADFVVSKPFRHHTLVNILNEVAVKHQSCSSLSPTARAPQR